MKLSGIIESSAVAIVSDVPDAQLFAPDIIAALVSEYRFVDFPKTVEQYKTDLSLAHGWFDSQVIDKLSVYTDGVFASTQANSRTLETFFEDILRLLNDRFGVDLRSNPRKVFYNSKMEVILEPGIDGLFERLDPLCKLLDRITTNRGFEGLPYKGIAFGLYAGKKGLPLPAAFKSNRELGMNCQRIVFFGAPVTTDEHCEILKELERLF